jgi:hypothetical protein
MNTTRNPEPGRGNRPVRSETFKRIWLAMMIGGMSLMGLVLALFGDPGDFYGFLISMGGFFGLLFAGAVLYHKRPEWSVFAIALMLSSVAWDLSARYLFGLSRLSVIEAMLDWRLLSYVVSIFLGDYLIRRYRERRGARR